MLRVLLLTVVVALGFVNAQSKTCIIQNGNKVTTFSGTKEAIKFGCKVPMIRDTICGNWIINISPTMKLDGVQRSYYFIYSTFASFEKRTGADAGKKFEGRTSIKIIKKYIADTENRTSFEHLDGSLTHIDSVGESDTDDDNTITVDNKDFTLTMGCYDPSDSASARRRNSFLSFKCKSKDFQPKPYPDQICGNGTKKEVKNYRKLMGWKGNRNVAIMYNALAKTGVAQPSGPCQTMENKMREKKDISVDDQYEIIKKCWKISASPIYTKKCLESHAEVLQATKNCVEFVASNYTDVNSCELLGDQLDTCSTLSYVTPKVKSLCASTLVPDM